MSISNIVVRSLKPILTPIVIMTCATTAAAWDEDIVISTDNNSLVLSANYGEAPRFTHYGPLINGSEAAALSDLGSGLNRPAYPAFGDEYRTLTSLQLVHPDGNPTTYLVLDKVEKTDTDRGRLTTLILKDKHYPVTVKLNYLAIGADDVIETWSEVTNQGKKELVVRRLDSGFLPIRRGDVWLSHLHGDWTAECYLTSEPLTRGVKTIKNNEGSRNAHTDHAEIMLSLDGEPRENDGATIGAVLCWSGNYEIRIDTDNQFCHNIMAGRSGEMSEYRLAPGKTMQSPKLALTYSTEGLGGVSRNLHRWARHGAIHGGDKPRDILLNSWEGVYLDVNEEKMDEMMRDFADLGGELFVMDDGWFGEKYPRRTDKTALGDWVVDREKQPNGIEGLIKTAKKYGLKFGLWIEPESTNIISELYDKHPDWVMRVKNRDLRPGRGDTQLLLDLSNPEVQEFVFGVVDNLMTKYPDIAYMKWDANVEGRNYGSGYLPDDRQLEINTAYHNGLEKALQRIRQKYPDLVLQACGGGGGRANYGTMPYFDEIWVSDNTDPLQRVYMQWGTSLLSGMSVVKSNAPTDRIADAALPSADNDIADATMQGDSLINDAGADTGAQNAQSAQNAESVAPQTAPPAVEAEAEPTPAPVTSVSEGKYAYYVVMGVFSTEQNANRALEQVKRHIEDLNGAILPFKGKFITAIFGSDKRDDCASFARSYRDIYPDLWIYNVK